jgi:inner membrane protein
MASLGHIAVGIAAARIFPGAAPRARPSLAAIVFWSLLSFFPDADVIGFGLGISYGDEWGHRGATHSLVFSLALGVVIGLAAARFGRPALRTGALASLVLASHALLDTLTNGGLGCALFWPFDLTRYFAPWNPIPVAPIGLSFFSPYGMFVAASELLLFAPLIWFALAPGRGGRTPAGGRPAVLVFLVVAWLAGLWLTV